MNLRVVLRRHLESKGRAHTMIYKLGAISTVQGMGGQDFEPAIDPPTQSLDPYFHNSGRFAPRAAP